MKLQLSEQLLIVAVAAGNPLARSPAQAPADAAHVQKVSQTEGCFLGTLHDGDEFGHAITVLPIPFVGLNLSDGYAEVVTAPGDDDGGPDRGAFWILETQDSWNGVLKVAPQIKFSSSSDAFLGRLDDGDRLGSSVAGSFGESLYDILIGAAGDDDGGTDRGAIYATSVDHEFGTGGPYTLLLHSKISATSGGFTGALDDFDAFGASMAWLGDLDNDGGEDVAVGAPGDDDGGADRGAVWILFLNPDRTVKSHAKISATSGAFTGALDDGDGFGSALSYLYDAGGPWSDDMRRMLAVGAPADDDGGSDRGALWILQLNTDGTVQSHGKLSATSPGFQGVLADGDHFGSAACLALPGTFFGWPFGWPPADLVVGAPGTDAGGLDAGAVYRLSLLLPDLSIQSYQAIHANAGGLGGVLDAGDRFGSSLPSINNWPGVSVTVFANVQVGAPGDDDGGPDRGGFWDVSLPYGDPPVAAFSAVPTSGVAPLEVQFLDETSGIFELLLHVDRWDFGDGTVVDEPFVAENPPHPSLTHTYALPGVYSVTLEFWGHGGIDAATRTNYIVVDVPSAPTADFTAQTTDGWAPLEVAFTDTSTSHVDTWAWDFGDGGSSSLQHPTHTYAAGGDYTVSLTVAGLGGSDSVTKVDLVHVVDPFAVDFGADPMSGFAPLDVTFTNLSAGTPEGWLWDFGDGATSDEASPVHTYADAGLYTVTLSALQGDDSIDETKPDLIDAQGPTAQFSGTPLSGPAPVTVQFTDLSTGTVTAWAWDFGDGTGSTEQHPSHAYPYSGDYTVSLEVTGAGTSSSETKTDYVHVDPGLPVADFTATPTSGEAPLAVQFTDLSFDATGWSWDFGDGTGSLEQHPLHTYVFGGVYTVTLTASNSFGDHVLARPDYVTCVQPPGLYDPSFELQTAGTQPTGSWEIVFGGGHVVNPAGGATADNAFPTDGSQWCEVAADSTVDATPPSNPGGETDPPLGAGVGTTFRWLAGRPLLEFDAAFLVNGPPDQAATNDWMSVDVSDGIPGLPGVTTFNLYYADTFSDTPDVSAKYGFAMTATTRVGANLAVLFPLSTPDTDLVLTVQVGNGGDGLLPSKGYVDDFRLEPDAAVTLYGSGVNPPGSLSLFAGTPALGGSVLLGVDNPLGTQPPLHTVPILFFSLAADPAFPAGTLVPGLGMDGGSAELLIRLGSFALRTRIVGPPWQGAGIPALVTVDVPNDPSLIGATLFTQGLLAAPGASPSLVRYGLADAARLIVGP